jgi:hypothetical protein
MPLRHPSRPFTPGFAIPACIPEDACGRWNPMNPEEAGDTYTYGIDFNDVVIGVSENWQRFAEQNRGGSACLPQNIIGSSLWSHISDWETRQLYEAICGNVRERQRGATFRFRCDSPEIRRFLILAVTPMPRHSLFFTSQIVRTESRKPVELLMADAERSDEFLRICSMCKKIALSTTQWVEVEDAVQKLGLFEMNVMPKFSHGICQECFAVAMAELDGD